jgi:hypothetical protein
MHNFNKRRTRQGYTVLFSGYLQGDFSPQQGFYLAHQFNLGHKTGGNIATCFDSQLASYLELNLTAS